jgi:hypothetical protein
MSNTYGIESSEMVCPGITRLWLSDRHVVAFKITAMSKIILAQWTNIVIQTLEAWPSYAPYLALHDLSTAGVSLQYASLVNFDTMNLGITPVGRKQATNLLEIRGIPAASVALNFNLSVSGQVNKVLADNRNSSTRSTVAYKTFYSWEKSLAWLSSSLVFTAVDRM